MKHTRAQEIRWRDFRTKRHVAVKRGFIVTLILHLIMSIVETSSLFRDSRNTPQRKKKIIIII
jgi:hypothetical protein